MVIVCIVMYNLIIPPREEAPDPEGEGIHTCTSIIS